jgi:hypothetical protein
MLQHLVAVEAGLISEVSESEQRTAEQPDPGPAAGGRAD